MKHEAKPKLNPFILVFAVLAIIANSIGFLLACPPLIGLIIETFKNATTGLAFVGYFLVILFPLCYMALCILGITFGVKAIKRHNDSFVYKALFLGLINIVILYLMQFMFNGGMLPA